MSRRIGLLALGIAALTLSSCGAAAEQEQLRADLDATRAELKALKEKVEAEEKAKADAAAAKHTAKAEADAARVRAETLEAEMRKRWNEVGPRFEVAGFSSFRWAGPNAFPHPTFKGGSAEAYSTFAKTLVAFLEAGDNFEFMMKNGMFTTDIGFGGTGKIRLLDFADALAKKGSLGAGDEPTREKLEAFVKKMRAGKA